MKPLEEQNISDLEVTPEFQTFVAAQLDKMLEQNITEVWLYIMHPYTSRVFVLTKQITPPQASLLNLSLKYFVRNDLFSVCEGSLILG